VTLSTSEGPDVIIVGCDCFPLGTAFSVKDTAGLTFSARTAQLSVGGGQFLQEWYAVAPHPLSSDVVSVTTADSGETWYGMIAFGVSGANTASPFDPNSALPAAQSNNPACPASDPCDTKVSTSNANDFVFQIGGDTGGKLQTAGPGLFLIQSTTKGQDVYAQYGLTSTSLVSSTLSFGTSQGNDFAVVADAIVSASSATTGRTSAGLSASAFTSGDLGVGIASLLAVTGLVATRGKSLFFSGIMGSASRKAPPVSSPHPRPVHLSPSSNSPPRLQP
jgi:hypothetical protein